jgi:CRISPR-associated endoribonuclease Cas6
MLQKICVKCSYAGGLNASYNWGSLMHGVLIELLPGVIAEDLHDNSLRPFSQYIVPVSDGMVEWHIGAWDDVVSDAIAKALMSLMKIEIKHKDITLNVQDVNRSILTEKEFISRFFANASPSRYYNLDFVTPCTHKSGGEYVLFPSAGLIVQSLYMRFCAFSQEVSIDDPEVLEHLCEHTSIVYYSLRSARYSFKERKIRGYIGRVTLAIRGPEQIARLVGMLLSFAEYAGVGIKTSLGMGGCKVKPYNSV